MKILRMSMAAIALMCPLVTFAITFTPGHFYSTSDSAINEYSPTGSLLSSFSSSSDDLRGISFGPGGLLYVVHAGSPFSSSARVEAIDASGTVVRSYAFTGSISGNISYGKIGFDSSGQHFYVGAENGVYKFDVSGASGSLYKNVEAFDLKVLPTGDLLVASSYSLSRFSSSGQLLGTISSLTDPNGLTGDSSPFLVDVRGVEYDPASNTTFATMLGYSGTVNMSFKVLALAGNSGVISGIENYWYGDDLLVTNDGKLVVGSRTQAPGLFTTSLSYQGQFGGPEARFITMLPVPEPSTAWALALGIVSLGLFRGVRRSKWAAPPHQVH